MKEGFNKPLECLYGSWASRCSGPGCLPAGEAPRWRWHQRKHRGWIASPAWSSAALRPEDEHLQVIRTLASRGFKTLHSIVQIYTDWWRVTHWTAWLGLHSSAALPFPHIVSFQGLRNHSQPWHCSGGTRKRYGKAPLHLPLWGELAALYLKVWLSRMKLRTFCAVWASMRWASRSTSSKLNMEMMGWSLIPREANISTAPCILSITTMASVTFEDFTGGSDRASGYRSKNITVHKQSR